MLTGEARCGLDIDMRVASENDPDRPASVEVGGCFRSRALSSGTEGALDYRPIMGVNLSAGFLV